jgi:hypothetical protein
MHYEVCQGSKFVGRYDTEAEALRALLDYCRVEGVPDAETFQAMSMDLWRIDESGHRTRRWFGAAIADRFAPEASDEP